MKVMGANDGSFNVSQLGDEANKRILRFSPEFVTWAKNRADAIRRAAEAEIKLKKEEICAHFEELGRPAIGDEYRSFYGGRDTNMLPNTNEAFRVITNRENIADFIAKQRRRKNNKEFIKSYDDLIERVKTSIKNDGENGSLQCAE
ncbi:MAG: hypothetical protein HY981_00180 [Candidatus Magasanikbacteria bacterium]|nr:hypothetical protein [Candidatus Magasanikbacteria bacterium]